MIESKHKLRKVEKRFGLSDHYFHITMTTKVILKWLNMTHLRRLKGAYVSCPGLWRAIWSRFPSVWLWYLYRVPDHIWNIGFQIDDDSWWRCQPIMWKHIEAATVSQSANDNRNYLILAFVFSCRRLAQSWLSTNSENFRKLCFRFSFQRNGFEKRLSWLTRVLI